MRIICKLTQSQINAIIEWSIRNDREHLANDEAVMVELDANAELEFDVTRAIIESIL